MNITLIHPSSDFLINDAVFPPLGIMYLSAYLKQYGIGVQCLDMSVGHSLDDIQYNVVGVSFTTAQRKGAYEIVKQLKHSKYLIAGGAHATHMAQECFDRGFEAVIPRYGEAALLNLLDRSSVRKQPPIDLLPFPDRDSLPVHKYSYTIDGIPATPVMTSRGCPASCSFCAKISKTYEVQSFMRTANEIDHIEDNYGFKAFMIFDDVFVADKKRLRLLSKYYENRGLKFRCFARTSMVNEEICEQLKQMGVIEVGLGVESGSASILKINMKGTTPAMNTRAVQLLRDYGIRTKAFLIAGLPGESVETLQETEQWIQEAQPYDIDMSLFQPLPGSPIFDNPERFQLRIDYDHADSMWYKGRPNSYKTNVVYATIDTETLVAFRNRLESEYKNKELLK